MDAKLPDGDLAGWGDSDRRAAHGAAALLGRARYARRRGNEDAPLLLVWAWSVLHQERKIILQ